jgi:Domain of unknown function (DUF4349)
MPIAFTHRESPFNLRHRRRMAATGALSALLLSGLVLSGCSKGDSTASTEGRVGVTTPAQGSAGRNTSPGFSSASEANSAAGAKGAPGAPLGAADVAKPGAPVPGVGPKLTKSANLDLQVKDIGAAAAKVRGIATGLQAQVLSEQIGKGGPGDPVPVDSQGNPSEPSSSLGGFGTLTLSVPSDKLDTALDQLGKGVGTVLRRSTSSQDVTSQYVDTESRLKTMRASVDRVRALMARAKDIGQVVALESEMSRRQADLESLESQLAALKNSVERSTLAVSLSTPGNEPTTDSGFVAGLRSGWDAFTASASGLFKAIGTALPFVIFFALLGIPLWSSWRRRRTTHPTVSPATP